MKKLLAYSFLLIVTLSILGNPFVAYAQGAADRLAEIRMQQELQKAKAEQAEAKKTEDQVRAIQQKYETQNDPLRSGRTEMLRTLQQYYSEIQALEKKPEELRTAEEKQELQNLKEQYQNLKESYDALGNEIAGNLTNQHQEIKNTQYKTPEPKFAGMELCGNLFVNMSPFGGSNGNIQSDIPGCAAAIANTALELATIPFAVAGYFLDYSVEMTITKFSDALRKDNGQGFYTPINNIWQLIKNICNIFFIVALLYIAITTILQANGFQERQKLLSILAFAILINFSMIFTKFVIDISNTLSVSVLNTIIQSRDAQAGNNQSLANVFLANMNIQRFLDYDEKDRGQGIYLKNESNDEFLSLGVIFTHGILGAMVLLVAAIVLAVIAGMLVIRYIMLIVLLMTSPIYFVKSFTPSFISQYGDMWYKHFKANILFLPALMIMFYISMHFSGYTSEMVKNGIAQGTGGYINLLFGYVITISLLIMSIIVAKSTGGSAGVADVGLRWAKGLIGGSTAGLAARVGRRTIGFVGSEAADSKLAKSIGYSNSRLLRFSGASTLARKVMKQGDALANKTFDIRNTAAGKSLGMGDGLKEGYTKGIKAVNEELKKKREEMHIKDASKKAEATNDEKDRKEILEQRNRAEIQHEEAKKQEESFQKEYEKLDEESRNVAAKVDKEILEEKAKMSKDVVDIDRELVRLATALAGTTNANERLVIQGRRADLTAKKRDLNTKMSGIAAERNDRITRETNRIGKDMENALKGLNLAKERVAQTKKNYDVAEGKVKLVAKNKDDLIMKVRKDEGAQEERRQKYLRQLEGMMEKRIFSGINHDKYKEQYAKEMKEMYKSKDDKDAKKLLDQLKKQLKEGEEETT